jgi:hypothetical protein
MKKAWQKRCPECGHQIFKLWASHAEWACMCSCHRVGWELHRLDKTKDNSKAEMLRSIERHFNRAEYELHAIYAKKLKVLDQWYAKARRRLEARMAISKKKVRNMTWKPTSIPLCRSKS